MFFQGCIVEMMLNSIAATQPIPALETAKRYVQHQNQMLAKKGRLKLEDQKAVIDFAEHTLLEQLASQNQLAQEEKTETESGENHGEV
jgi:hypothetical protein